MIPQIYIYDITFLVVFTLAVIIFLWIKRKNLKREGVMYLYRTQLGIKLINYIGGKYKKTLRILSFFSVICGYFLMASIVYMLYLLIRIYLFQPQIVQAAKIFPFMPLVPYVPEIFKVSFLPPFYFTYWIIAIAVIAICHEFSHGIFARRYDVPIKSTGFGFLGPLLAAFVEPDDKVMEKKPKFQQITILSAGTFANVILTIIFFLLFIGFFHAAYSPSGVMFDYSVSNVNIGNINSINGIKINDTNNSGIINLIEKNGITDNLNLCNEYNSNFSSVSTRDGIKYLIPIENLKSQLKSNKTEVTLFYDGPAIRSCLSGIHYENNSLQIEGGVIEKIGNENIKSWNDISKILDNYKPGDKINITTLTSISETSHEVILGANPLNKTKALIGISTLVSVQGNFVFNAINKIQFKDPQVYYKPKFNPDLTIFIYNLLWWLILINFSVALINMWPVAIFDGGRTFMLTVWAITKSEKFAKIAFKVVSYAILAAVLIIIYGYFSAVF